MKKKFLLVLILFFISTSNVNAYIEDDCLNDGTCMLLCNYINYKKSATDNNHLDLDRNLSIYYYFDTNEFKISWETVPHKTVKTKKGTIDFVFSTSGTHVYWGISEKYTISNFVCPQYGFIDMDNAWDSNELCFDDDGTTCSTKYSNYATSFGIVANYSSFASHKKDYDFEEELINYLDNDFEEILTEINKGKFDIKTDLQTRIENDFNNYFQGKSIPPFMNESPAYTNFEANLLERYEKRKEEELKKAEQEKNSKVHLANKEKQIQLDKLKNDLMYGLITMDEYKERVAEIEKAADEKKADAEKEQQERESNWESNPEDIKSQVDLAFKNLKEKVSWSGDFKVDNCESYLGNPLEKGSPASYLQFIFNLIKYAAIVLLFVLSGVEMAKAMTSNNQDALKKALTVTIKRLLIAVIIFFLPELIKFLLTILGAYSPSTCGIS